VDLYEVLEQVISLLQKNGRVSSRALKKLSLRGSLKQPLILIFEDLHWIDSETQGFVGVLSESVASAKLLLLINYRPEYHHEWGEKTYYTQVRLAPFGNPEADEFLTSLLGHGTTLAALKHQILSKTEGTPFFIEEVVQALVEDGTLTGERVHEAELYRLKGELTLQQENKEHGAKSRRAKSSLPNPRSYIRGRSAFPQSPRHRPQAASQIARTPCDDEPCPSLAAPGQAARSSRVVICDL